MGRGRGIEPWGRPACTEAQVGLHLNACRGGSSSSAARTRSAAASPASSPSPGPGADLTLHSGAPTTSAICLFQPPFAPPTNTSRSRSVSSGPGPQFGRVPATLALGDVPLDRAGDRIEEELALTACRESHGALLHRPQPICTSARTVRRRPNITHFARAASARCRSCRAGRRRAPCSRPLSRRRPAGTRPAKHRAGPGSPPCAGAGRPPARPIVLLDDVNDRLRLSHGGSIGSRPARRQLHRNGAPPPALFSTRMVPPSSSTTERAIDSPRPCPPSWWSGTTRRSSRGATGRRPGRYRRRRSRPDRGRRRGSRCAAAAGLGTSSRASSPLRRRFPRPALSMRSPRAGGSIESAVSTPTPRRCATGIVRRGTAPIRVLTSKTSKYLTRFVASTRT